MIELAVRRGRQRSFLPRERETRRVQRHSERGETGSGTEMEKEASETEGERQKEGAGAEEGK